MLPIGRQYSRNQRRPLHPVAATPGGRQEGAMRSTALMMVLLAGAAGLSGCQCCVLTEPLSHFVDLIADHEYAKQYYYHPELDLSRIGRRDWCRCRLNRMLCPCACARIRPAPCGYVVCRDTGLLLPHRDRHSQWPESGPVEETNDQLPLEEHSDEQAPPPPALQEGDVPPIPGEERLEQDLQLP
jgi:hypothetical protein